MDVGFKIIQYSGYYYNLCTYKKNILTIQLGTAITIFNFFFQSTALTLKKKRVTSDIKN